MNLLVVVALAYAAVMTVLVVGMMVRSYYIVRSIRTIIRDINVINARQWTAIHRLAEQLDGHSQALRDAANILSGQLIFKKPN